jgi:hypothetical protein
MKKLFWLPLAAAALTAGTAAAQRPLVPGEVTSGSLTRNDPRNEDGRAYDEYAFEARRGETVIVRMESESFDTYLYLGTSARRFGWRELARDDDGGDGTDSRIRYVVPEDGIYVVRASSLNESSGPYEITLQGGRATSGYNNGGYDDGYNQPQPARPRPRDRNRRRDGYVRAGDRIDGYLSNTDPTLDNGAPFHVYTYSGRRGERVTVTLRSDDFDSYLVLGTPGGRHGVNAALTRDDDGAGGHDSRIVFTFPNDGDFVIRVNPLAAGTGEYTLDVESSLGGGGYNQPQEEYYEDEMDELLIGRWALVNPTVRVQPSWSTITSQAAFGFLEVRSDGSYTWNRNGSTRRGQLEPMTPRRGSQAGTQYYRISDGRDDYYLFFTEVRGERRMQVNGRATDAIVAYGFRDPNSRR